MHTKPTVTFLVGPPGSGKTTFRNTIDDAATVSSDDLIEQWATAHDLTYSEAFHQVDTREIERNMLAVLDAAVAANQHVIIDRTNMTRKGRAKLFAHIPPHYQRIAVVFELPRDELNRRLAARTQTGKHIASEVIDTMLDCYEAPSGDEFDIIR